MVRLFYVLSVSTILAACGVIGLCARDWSSQDAEQVDFLCAPGAVQRFTHNAGQREADGVEKVAPLDAGEGTGFAVESSACCREDG
jgi:hypothetical protein